MDRDGLLAFVKRKLRIDTTGEGLLTDATLVFFINEGVRHFSRERHWPWLLTSASVSISTSGIATLPTDFVAARQLIYSNDPVTYVGFDELISGRSRYVWTEDGVNIRVEPAPAATTSMTLWYYQKEDDLSASASTPIAPSLYHDAIGLWAAHLGAQARRDFDMSRDFVAEYQGEIARMEKDVFRKKGSVVRVMRRDEIGTTAAVW